MKSSNVELTRGEKNVCQNPNVAKDILIKKHNGDRGRFAIYQILYHILNKSYHEEGIHNANISINPTVIEYIFNRLQEEDSDIGSHIYKLLKTTNTSLTGAMGEKELPDTVVRGVLNVSQQMSVGDSTNSTSETIKNILDNSGIIISEKEERHSSLGYYDMEKMSKKEEEILAQALEVNVEEHLAILENLECITEDVALITVILLSHKKFSWSDLKQDTQIKILQELSPEKTFFFTHTEWKDVTCSDGAKSRQGNTFETRIPGIFTSKSEISTTIVHNDTLWNTYMEITDPKRQYLTSSLVYNSNEGKEKAKKANEFQKLVQAKNYSAIWNTVVTDCNHSDFSERGDNCFEILSTRYIHWNDVPESFQKQLLTDIGFLQAGCKISVEVNLGTALGALLRNIESTVIMDDDIWNTFLQDDSVMSSLLWTSASARKKMENRDDFQKLIDGSMKNSLASLTHDNPEFQRHIVNDSRLFEFFLARGFHKTLFRILGSYGDKEAKKNIFGNDYLFTLCLQGNLFIDSMLREQPDKEVDQKFQNNSYFRRLAIQNLGDSDLHYIFWKSTHQWPEINEQVLQGFAQKGYERTLIILASDDRWNLSVPEPSNEYKIAGGYISKKVDVILKDSVV